MIFIQRKKVSSLEEIAKKEFLSNSAEIFPIEFENQRYWIKRARQTKANKIQKFFYRFFPLELLIPSLNKTALQALDYETSKLEKFRSLGINTPKVVYKCDDFFVLEDCGNSVNAYLRDKNITKEKFYDFVEKLLFELAKIHNQNEFHGGTQIRNFTYKNDNVYVIDLEESFSNSTDIETLKFRDFLLFILSFVKMKELSFEVDYFFIINRYKELTKSDDLTQKLRNFSKKISFFIWLSNVSFIKKRLGSDVKNFFKLFEILNSLEK